MTIGIGAICESDGDNPKIVAAADRMMTRMGSSPREFEHTKSKIEGYDLLEDCNFVVIGSGTSGLIELFTNSLEKKLRNLSTTQEDEDSEEIERHEDVVSKAQEAYQDTITERINNKILGNYGLEFDDLTSKEYNEGIIASLTEKAEDERMRLRRNLRVIIAGKYENSPFIYDVGFGDYNNKSSTSFCTIGSGAEPAVSAFIQAEYDDSCDLEESIMKVFEAKKKSEKAQGVGDEKTDFVVVENGNIKEISDENLSDIGKEYDSYHQEVKKAREKFISDAKQKVNIGE
jgi:hypothetical protein